MIRSRALIIAFSWLAVAMLQTACEKRPDFGAKPGPDGKIPESWHFLGEPDPAKAWKPPTDVTSFETLYSENCIACHGRGSTVAASIAMDNQIYLNIVSKDVLTNIITHGVKGTRMPGFGKEEGGGLSAAQIDTLVNGILAWKKPVDLSAGALPTYSAPAGNAANGQALFSQSFAKDLPPTQTYLNPAFLGLVSDQYLRTLVIVGQPELGYPDFRSFIPGRSLTDQDVSDVVAWLISNRKNEYGEPLVPAPGTPAP